MYNQTEKEEIPIANPINNLANINESGLGAHPDHAAPITNMTLHSKWFSFFRKYPILPETSHQAATANPAVVMFSTILLLK